MKSVLVEGWRGINHSYAMVNQYQLAELMQMPDISLAYCDLPYANASWSVTQNNPGFPESFLQKTNNIPTPQDIRYDCVYRIAWPYSKTTVAAERVLTFMTAEYGVNEFALKDVLNPFEAFCSGDDKIVVPSKWSRDRLLDYGYPESGVEVVPHGVHPEIFQPLSPIERESVRTNMGFGSDEFVFLNIGAMSWNKGLDILLRAFSQVKKKYSNARLVLKDDRQLYGIGVQEVVSQLLNDPSAELDSQVLSSVNLLSATLTMDSIRNLYATADTYVSAYRAEGFNLPVIEAMACGTPVIVTEGGPTDDYCQPAMCRKIVSSVVPNEMRGIQIPGKHLEPSLESLIEAMSQSIEQSHGMIEIPEARGRLLETYSWASCTQMLARLF